MPARLILGLDTSGERCSVGLLDAADGRLLASAEPTIGKGHAERLMGIVDDVLGEAGCGYRDLSGIAVAIGPGSFTGIRVGVAAARGLSLALDRPLVGVDNLEILAAPHAGDERPVLAAIDAKRGELYVALHAPGGTRMREARAVTPETLASYVVADVPRVIATGSGAEIAALHLREAGMAVEIAPACVSVRTLLAIAAHRAPGGPVSPLYLRGADAKPQAAPALFAPATPMPPTSFHPSGDGL